MFSIKGSRDNMSIIIIAFPAAPAVDPAAVKQENELDALLEKKVTGVNVVSSSSSNVFL